VVVSPPWYDFSSPDLASMSRDEESKRLWNSAWLFGDSEVVRGPSVWRIEGVGEIEGDGCDTCVNIALFIIIIWYHPVSDIPSFASLESSLGRLLPEGLARTYNARQTTQQGRRIVG